MYKNTNVEFFNLIDYPSFTKNSLMLTVYLNVTNEPYIAILHMFVLDYDREFTEFVSTIISIRLKFFKLLKITLDNHCPLL